MFFFNNAWGSFNVFDMPIRNYSRLQDVEKLYFFRAHATFNPEIENSAKTAHKRKRERHGFLIVKKSYPTIFWKM